VQRLPAVAHAESRPYAFEFDATVQTQHVQPGDLVQTGDILLTLESPALLEQLQALDAETERLERLAQWEMAQLDDRLSSEALAHQITQQREQLTLEQAEARSRLARDLAEATEASLDAIQDRYDRHLIEFDTLASAQLAEAEADSEADYYSRLRRQQEDLLASLSAAEQTDPDELRQHLLNYYASELAAVRVQQQALRVRIAGLQVRADQEGVVADVLPRGTLAQSGTILASVLPVNVTEVIAYLPTDWARQADLQDIAGRLSTSVSGCDAQTTIRAVGAHATVYPAQLSGPLFRQQQYGIPVHLEIPEGCHLIPGQTLQAQLTVP
ncbi:MAG: biotin/lipoyl-binding protein, partial [Myxococcales bacterium]|nr:biotin/lipoyl-binding protein [Myxococcales bacterium]